MDDNSHKPLPALSRTYLEPHRLEHFLAAYETGNLRLAARKTGVSQQAVSKAIAKLEDSLQIRLFERRTTGVEPNIFAHHLARRAKLILSESRLAALEIDSLKGAKQGSVTLGIGPSFAPRLLPLAAERMHKLNPEIAIEGHVGHTEKIAPLVSNGQLEFAITAPSRTISIPEDLQIEELNVEVDSVFGRANHPLASKSERDIIDYTKYPWVSAIGLPGSWSRTLDIFTAEGCEPPRNLLRTDSLALVMGYIESSDALALLGRHAIDTHIRLGTVVEIPLKRLIDRRRILLLQRKRTNLGAAASVLKRVLLETMRTQGFLD